MLSLKTKMHSMLIGLKKLYICLFFFLKIIFFVCYLFECSPWADRTLWASPSEEDFTLVPSTPFPGFRVARLPFLPIFSRLHKHTHTHTKTHTQRHGGCYLLCNADRNQCQLFHSHFTLLLSFITFLNSPEEISRK